jgi:hypothetical protein
MTAFGPTSYRRMISIPEPAMVATTLAEWSQSLKCAAIFPASNPSV